MALQNPLLHRYWFRVNESVGFGVTAYSRADAETLLAQSGLPESLGWKTADVTEDVDISTLENFRRNYHFGPPNWRGVWCPFFPLPSAREYPKDGT